MGKSKAQSALDFMASYGLAFLIISIALVVIYKSGFTNPNISPISCTPQPGFACGFFSINRTGVLTITLSQATGAEINVHGIACSSDMNKTGNIPKYGNIFVTANSLYYPANSVIPNNGIPFYSDGTRVFKVICYSSSGIASGPLGTPFFGYVWLNYTLEGYTEVTQEVAIVSAKYT